MNDRIGTTLRNIVVAPRFLAVAGVTLGATMLACSTFAAAADTSSPATRFSDSGLLDTARNAAATQTSTGPVNIGIPPPDELRLLEARRDAELKRLSEKLRRAADQHGSHSPAVIESPSWATEVAAAPVDEQMPATRSGLGARPSDSAEYGRVDAGRATILLIMGTAANRALDARASTDPILCVTDGCFVSNGAQAPATYHSFTQSLGLGGRFSRGAGECNHASVCVFRNVEIGVSPAMVQPINLRITRYDRREQSKVTIDNSCRVVQGRLSCSRPVRTASYTLWVVPENVAREVGPEMLTSALDAGLTTAQTAELPWIRQ